MPKKEETLFNLDVTFSKSPKKAVDRRALLKRIRSIIEKEKESLPFEDITFEKDVILMVTEDFFFAIGSKKPMAMKIALKKTKKNIEEGNNIANKLLNYMRTTLGDFAKNAKVAAYEIFPLKEKIGFSRKMIDEARLAKLNEIAKKVINPVGLMFEYSADGYDYLIISFELKEKTTLAAFSRYTYEDALPWDLLLNQHNKLLSCTKIIAKVKEV